MLLVVVYRISEVGYQEQINVEQTNSINNNHESGNNIPIEASSYNETPVGGKYF